jgi:phosphate transport system ATP-binding protein
VSPQVILMDEPVSSLDPPSAAKVEETIRSLRGDYTVVIVTHNMQQALRLSDYTAFLYMGKLVECGPTAELFHCPQCAETKEYIIGKFG